MRDKKTLVINLFGGPCSGKSTIAAGLFHKLKVAGINCEYVQEYAKECTWKEDWKSLEFQPYITANQMWRQTRVLGQVDVIVTDSPIMLGLIYQEIDGKKLFGCTPSFEKWVLEMFDLFNNMNFLLVRGKDHVFTQNGRKQSKEKSLEKDKEIQLVLDTNNIPYENLNVNKKAIDFLFNAVLQGIGKNSNKMSISTDIAVTTYPPHIILKGKAFSLAKIEKIIDFSHQSSSDFMFVSDMEIAECLCSLGIIEKYNNNRYKKTSLYEAWLKEVKKVYQDWLDKASTR